MKDIMYTRWLIYRAFAQHLEGMPSLDVDTYVELVNQGVNPERILERFQQGEIPPFAEYIEADTPDEFESQYEESFMSETNSEPTADELEAELIIYTEEGVSRSMNIE